MYVELENERRQLLILIKCIKFFVVTQSAMILAGLA